ncbi:hypothetical protein [Nonomuraea sp. NPDC049784]
MWLATADVADETLPAASTVRIGPMDPAQGAALLRRACTVEC